MNVFTPGTQHYYTGDEGNLYDIGNLAGPQVFDYSYIDLHNLSVSNNYSVGTIPILAERYPSDAITIGETPTTIEKNPVFLIRGDSVFTLGKASLVPEYSFSHNVPYQLMGKFPVTYGLAFSQNQTQYDTTYNSIWQILSTDESSSTEIVSIDAYGTLRLQSGDYDCLRMRRDHSGYGDKEFVFMTNESIFLDVFTSAASLDTGLVDGGLQIFFPASFVDVKNEKAPVAEFYLAQNYPNPFNPSTTISYQIKEQGLVQVKIFNLIGQEVATLVNEVKSAGAHKINWNADKFPSGVYFYQLQAGSFTQTKRMILMK